MNSEPQSFSTPFSLDGDSPGVVCGWDAPTGAQRVTFSSALIRELRQAAIQAFLAIPRRGVEIGGLLLGQVRQQSLSAGSSEAAVFEITASEDVPCEHRFGPSYILDDVDRNHLVELLARHQRDGLPPVVGFYRSYTGREARLDDADRELLQTFFPQQHFCCLLLQPLSMEKCTAGFRFWNGREILPEPAYASFSFEAAEMKQEAAEVPAAETGGTLPDGAETRETEAPEVQSKTKACLINLAMRHPAHTPSPEVSSTEVNARPYEDEDEEAAPRAFRPSRILLPLLFCILVAVASAATYELWKVTHEPRWVPVRLDARPSARELVLSWDATAPSAAQATRGVLAVTDGGNPVEIQLSAEQVRRGSFSYSPSHMNVLFQFRLYDRENPVTAESVRVIRLPIPDPVVAVVPATPLPAALATGSPVSPPEVRHEVQPVISPGIRTRILSRTVVPVIVKVDESGRVTQASSNVTSSKANGDGLERYLAAEAVKAARQWKFAPARSKEGSPVAATKTIPFEFGPAGQ